VISTRSLWLTCNLLTEKQKTKKKSSTCINDSQPPTLSCVRQPYSYKSIIYHNHKLAVTKTKQKSKHQNIQQKFKKNIKQNLKIQKYSQKITKT
jgi:hypothetical protein